MAELNHQPGKKIVTFYLPQFHTIPENDKWWGKGFTEWTNTRKAVPLFEGHYQPKTPLNENYYDLSDVTVMEKQAELAKRYGIFGFCYYHYWFKDGKKLLEKPIENMLKNPKVDIPFCLCWANENWTRNWDGGNREIIVEQNYGTQDDWEKHFLYFLDFFRDGRYITADGCPVLFIYKPEIIEHFNEMIDYWQKRIVEEGFPGIKIVCQFPHLLYSQLLGIKKIDQSRIDYYAKFEPAAEHTYTYAVGLTRLQQMKRTVMQHVYKVWNWVKKTFHINLSKKTKQSWPSVYDYDCSWDVILHHEPYGDNLINGGFVDWDNTARNKNGRLYKGATPEKFGNYMEALLKKPSALNMVVVNAWNEWAEGAYLEPDEKYGYAYLEALKRAKDNVESMQ